MSTHIWTAVTDDWMPLWELVRPNWEEYVARHGYTLHVQREFDASMPFTFAKIKAARAYLASEDCLELFVMDADIVFTNLSVDINKFGGAQPVSLTRDINGLNSGVLRLWNSETSFTWLDTVVALRGLCSSEQHAIQVLDESFSFDTDLVPHPSFNSIVLDEYPEYAGKYTEADGNWAPGHLLAHFPGMSMEQRLALIPKYLAQVVR